MPDAWTRVGSDGALLLGEGEDNVTLKMRDSSRLEVAVQRVQPPDAAGRGGGASTDRFNLHPDHLPALVAWLAREVDHELPAVCPACDGEGAYPDRPAPTRGAQSDVQMRECTLCEDGVIHVTLTGGPTDA